MKCEHEGCKERASGEWRIEGYDPVPVFHFCDEHAAEFGFCTSCGAFIGGTEDVFLTGQTGLCFDCYISIKDELEGDERFEGDGDDADFWADEDDYRGDPYADDDSDVETEQAHRAIDIEKRSQVGYDDIPF